MLKLPDIGSLATALIAQANAQTSTKTASETSSLKTEVGNAIKSAAELIRAADLNTVSYDDLSAMLKNANANCEYPKSAEMASPAAPAVARVSKTAQMIQDLANAVRSEGAEVEAGKVTKSAQALLAATGLAHLTSNSFEKLTRLDNI